MYSLRFVSQLKQTMEYLCKCILIYLLSKPVTQSFCSPSLTRTLRTIPAKYIDLTCNDEMGASKDYMNLLLNQMSIEGIVIKFD